MRIAGFVFHFVVFLLVFSARAQEPPAEDETTRDTLGWHVVQPGETLEEITERYLGTSRLWPENARLNPGISNPHQIFPGQRIRVIVQRDVPARQVEIRKISREVDKNLQSKGWQDATEGDLLKPRDGVRTQQESSTELRFDDGSSLTLGEYSQVFVKEVRTTLTGVRRGTIEIERGQADLMFRAARPDTTEIEVVTGDATTRPRVGPSGRSQTRARKSEEGGSQVMVYGGKAEVEAGGVKVAVEKGMGTAVPEGEAPKPPEKLLPRPGTVSPARRSTWAYGNPQIRWRAVSGAVSYTVEVCRDDSCGQLVARAADVASTSWQPRSLPSGELFWRVTAKAASGLDGYPSRAVAFRIDSDRVDLEAPVVVALLRGSGTVLPDGKMVIGQDGGIQLDAHDDVAGVAAVRFRWDDGDWKSYGGGVLRPSSPGAHLLELKAEDRLGHQSETWSLQVELDMEAPPLPDVRVPET